MKIVIKFMKNLSQGTLTENVKTFVSNEAS